MSTYIIIYKLLNCKNMFYFCEKELIACSTIKSNVLFSDNHSKMDVVYYDGDLKSNHMIFLNQKVFNSYKINEMRKIPITFANFQYAKCFLIRK